MLTSRSIQHNSLETSCTLRLPSSVDLTTQSVLKKKKQNQDQSLEGHSRWIGNKLIGGQVVISDGREVHFTCETQLPLFQKPMGLVRDDPTKPLDDDGEIPKPQGRRWRFDSRLWNLLSTQHITCQVPPVLLALACHPYVSKKTTKKPPIVWLSASIIIISRCCGCGDGDAIAATNENNWEAVIIIIIMALTPPLLLAPRSLTAYVQAGNPTPRTGGTRGLAQTP